MARPLWLGLALSCSSLPLALIGCREPARAPIAATPGALALAATPAAGAAAATALVDKEIAAIQDHLRKSPSQGMGDADTWAKLGRAFVLKARQSSDPGFYAQADDAAGRALSLDPNHPVASQVRQLVLLNAHRFVEARALATQQIAAHPRDEIAWGTLGDSLLELGDYDGAIDAYQKMVDLKPDLRSYNRAGWARWLIGDADGAVDLMKLAIDAGSTLDPESRAYCRVQLGDLLTYRGQYNEARAAYDQALRELPRYAPALAARGRLQLALGDPVQAVADLRAALQIQPLTVVRATYIDALRAAGNDAEAAAQQARLETEGRREDPRALALFYASHHLHPDLAVELAQDELRRRPDIWSLDALAWALFSNGKLDEAWQAAVGATRLGTKDPRLLFHRGRIAAARHDAQEARTYLTAALAGSPTWDRRDGQEAREILAKLEPASDPLAGSQHKSITP